MTTRAESSATAIVAVAAGAVLLIAAWLMGTTISEIVRDTTKAKEPINSVNHHQEKKE